jgi:cell division protein FtsB
MFVRELCRRAHHFIGPSIAICAMAYFAYHMLQGERGLIAWQQLENKVQQAEAEFAALQREHDILENRVKLLRDESLCPDLLNERAKKVLGYIHPNEVMVVRKK